MPRQWTHPVFGRSPIALGRMLEVPAGWRARGEDPARYAVRPAGRGWDAGETIHRFASPEEVERAIADDALRCPGVDRIGWGRLPRT